MIFSFSFGLMILDESNIVSTKIIDIEQLLFAWFLGKRCKCLYEDNVIHSYVNLCYLHIIIGTFYVYRFNKFYNK